MYYFSSPLTSSYINMEFTLKWFVLFVIFSIVKSEFVIPEVEIEVLKPKGIRVSIPGKQYLHYGI